MADSVISVEGLSKKYRLGVARHDTLRDRLAHALRAPFQRNGKPTNSPEEFWALRDVSFEVKRGEVLGIIGRNGAGKSTLLKILSRITEPTQGRISIRGRVASLLEVGTGFHPELTGRENIFLNGAILGMSRAEIHRKFDEIVAFAEVERFLDTAVKHYSSGMYVRLAFAVAAHLEPEILIVDEVLAVGDLAFQKKCVGKIETVAREEGRMVLFVSHNLQVVRRLCSRALMLGEGRLVVTGEVARVLETYNAQAVGDHRPASLRGNAAVDTATVVSAQVVSLAGQTLSEVRLGAPWAVKIRFQVMKPCTNFVVAVGITTSDGTAVQTAWHPPQLLAAGDYEAVFEQTAVTLEAGHYTVIVGLSHHNRTVQQVEAARFDVTTEQANGFFPASAGVGIVLNSMQTRLRQL